MKTSIPIDDPKREYDGPIFFSFGFRPFFLVAAAWAVVSVVIWLAAFEGYATIPSVFDPFVWHAHEMIFGFVGAAIAGFLLTAVAAWTGRPPVRGAPLALLLFLWALGRLLVAYSERSGPWVAALADLAFFVLLTAVVAREVVAAGNVRNYGVIGMLGMLTLANILLHLSALGLAPSRLVGERLGIGVVVVLLGLIGGRITPAFTRNWLARQGQAVDPPALPVIDRVAHAMTGAAMAAWATTILPEATGILALAAAGAQAVRMSRWHGGRTLSEPIVVILHVGYAWVPLGLALLGLHAWFPAIDETSALHALTSGAMGTMILAVMTRATLGHTGRAIASTDGTTAIYALVVLAGIVRVVGPYAGSFYYHLLIVSGVCWMLAFSLFIAIYGPTLFKPRRDEPAPAKMPAKR